MCRHHHIHLEDIPWPVSVLKFNQAVDELQAGDGMIATTRDADVVGNLELLLSGRSGLHFEVFQRGAAYCIRVTRD